MKKIIFSLYFIALALGATAQVKIKDGSVTGSSTIPNSNAILELESNTKGLLYPRVALQATNLPAPMPVHIKGMMVYDTVSAGSAPYAVTPGIYYNDGTQWVRVPGRTDWLIFGNATAAVNGTPAGNTDSQYVRGRVAIGTTGADSVASPTSGSTGAGQQLAYLTVAGSDMSVNNTTIGRGGGLNSSNIAFGNRALFNNQPSGTTAGVYNVAVGSSTLTANTTGVSNVAVGYYALLNNTTGSYNTANGQTALQSNISGSQNLALGYQSLQFNTTANNNVAIGHQSMANINNTQIPGASNTAIGWRSLWKVTGANNTAIGASALNDNNNNPTTNPPVSGSYNIAIGRSAGASAGTYMSTITTGNYNIVIGNNAGGAMSVVDGTKSYQLNIGNVIYGNGVDSLPNPTVGAGKIGINVFKPGSSLDIGGSLALPARGGQLNNSPANVLGQNDYTMIFPAATSPTGTTTSVTLPDATYTDLTSAAGVSGNQGRMYRIANQSNSPISISTTSSQTISMLDGTSGTTVTLPPHTSTLFQSYTNRNPTNWNQVEMGATIPPLPLRTVTSGTTLNGSDYTVVYAGTGSSNFNLPDPTTSKGLTFRLVNASTATTGAGTMNLNYPVTVTGDATAGTAVTFTAMPVVSPANIYSVNSVLIQSDGTQWRAIGH